MDKSKLEALKRYYATQCGINATIELSTLRKLIALAERTTSPVSQMTDEAIIQIAEAVIKPVAGERISKAQAKLFARAILAAAAPHAQDNEGEKA